MKVKKVFVHAYADLNLGDDLFVKILLDRYPEVEFHMIGDVEYNNIFKEYKNLKIVENKSISFIDRLIHAFLKLLSVKLAISFIRIIIGKRYNSYLKEVDSILVIGGSMFQQNTVREYYYESEVHYYFANIAQKDLYYMGCNFGPYLQDQYLEYFKKIFLKAKDVSFRDTASYSLFKDLPNVRYNPDLVLSYQFEGVSRIKNSVGFSIVDINKFKTEISRHSYLEQYVSLINEYIKNQFHIKLFVFSKNEGDLEIITDIYKKLNSKDDVEIVIYDGNINNFMLKFGSVETVFCGRFHAMILGLVFKQKIVPFAYSKKMENMLKDLNYNSRILELQEFCDSEVLTILNTVETMPLFKVNDSSTTDSLNHFIFFDKFVKSSF